MVSYGDNQVCPAQWPHNITSSLGFATKTTIGETPNRANHKRQNMIKSLQHVHYSNSQLKSSELDHIPELAQNPLVE